MYTERLYSNVNDKMRSLKILTAEDYDTLFLKQIYRMTFDFFAFAFHPLYAVV